MGLKERRAREKAHRRKQILDAARKLLFDKGIEATSINQIAKKAELGIGTIYSYFKNKNEIFAALQEEGLAMLDADIAAVCQSGNPPAQKLKKIALAYLSFSEDHKDYFDIVNYFLAAPQIVFAPNLKTQIDRHGNRIISRIGQVIEDGMGQGLFEVEDPRKFAVAFCAALHGMIQFKKLRYTILENQNHRDLFLYTVHQLINGIAGCPNAC